MWIKKYLSLWSEICEYQHIYIHDIKLRRTSARLFDMLTYFFSMEERGLDEVKLKQMSNNHTRARKEMALERSRI